MSQPERAEDGDDSNGRLAGVLRRLHAADLLPLLIPLSLYAPMALHWESFSLDWGNHLFLVASMEHSIRALGHPSYFFHSAETGLFNPFFAFYGGTLYAVVGVLGLVVGSPVRAYVLSYGLCFAMSYAGMYWLARVTGLRSLAAHVPAIVTVTAAYYLTDAYERGAWPEFVAVSTIPLVVAGIVHLLAAAELHILPMLALYASMVAFSGSHNITLLWGSIVLALVAVAGAVAVGAQVIRQKARRIAVIGALLMLGVGTNLWFLLPDLVYGGKTVASRNPVLAYPQFDRAKVIFAPWRFTAFSAAPQLYVQISVYVLAWSLAVLGVAAFMRVGTRQARIFVAGLLAVGIAIVTLAIVDAIWQYLPSTLLLIQFPYRLEGYILILVAALSLAAVHAAVRLPRRRLTFALLALAVGCQVGLAEWQVWTAKHGPPEGAYYAAFAGRGHVPSTWYAFDEYRVDEGPLVAETGSFLLPAELVRDDRLAIAMPDAPGYYDTNIDASPFVRISGAATLAGHDFYVLSIVHRTGNEPKGALLTLTPKIPPAQSIGVAGSIASPLLLVCLCASVWWWRVRRRPSSSCRLQFE